jgi:uncharacterized protein (TIGR02246 family)
VDADRTDVFVYRLEWALAGGLDGADVMEVGKIRGVCFLTPEVSVLRAVAGMVPPGQADLNPAVNALQTLVATKGAGPWRIALFQNTPAQLHRRPELAQN